MGRPRELVIMREKHCPCGCKGRDPWHKLAILRAIWAPRPAREGEAYCLADGVTPVTVERVAVIMVPWQRGARVAYRAGRWWLARTPEEQQAGAYISFAASGRK